MFNRKVNAILFIFLILFCISAVHAESNDIAADVQSVDIVDVKSDNYIATISEESTETMGNYTELQDVVDNAQNNTEIKLNKSYIYSSESKYKNGIIINKTVTIEGNGQTIDGNHSARIFTIQKNGFLTIKNINLINGYSSDNGGAIIIYNGKLTAINSSFINNSVYSNGHGGAIFIYDYCSNFNIINSSFINNTANWGGAIRGNDPITTMCIVNSEFINNTAVPTNSVAGGGYGGALSTNGYMNVTDSLFVNNTGFGAGAISSFRETFIINSTFIHNIATNHNGGAISGSQYLLTVINSTFLNNSGISGGALFATINVINSTFINNTASTGGAISGHGNITNSKFMDNNASSGGGAVSTYDNGINITNSSFLRNTASAGGAVSGEGNIFNSTFFNNTAKTSGGAILTYGMNIINSKFVGNSANTKGGAIVGSVNVTNSSFINNSAVQGGAISNSADYNFINVSNSIFINNSADYGGAIAYNIDDTWGDTFYSDPTNILNSTFINNTAKQIGGALYLKSTNIFESKFIGNNATNGGAIFIDWGNLIINKSIFANNNATNGGAIYYLNTYYDKVYAIYLDYLQNPDDYKDLGDELEEYFNMTVEEYINMFLNMSGNVFLSIMDSSFDDNLGELGNDIFTAFTTIVKNNNYTKDARANIYANNTIINGTIATVLGNTTYYLDYGSEFDINVTVFVDGASVQYNNLIISDGENEYNTTYLTNGTYKIINKLLANFKTKSFTVIINNETDSTNYIVKKSRISTDRKININVTVEDTVYGEDVTGNITLTDDEGNIINITGEVTIEVNGKNYTVNVTNGTGKFVIDDQLDAGNYTLKATFNGTDEFESIDTTVDFEIGKADPNLDVNITDIEGNLTMNIIMNPDINGNVTVIIDNETFVVEIRNGSGRLDLSGLESGVHEFTVEFEGNNNYNPAETTGEFDTNGIVLEVDYLTKYYGSDKKLNIRLRDVLGNPLANQNVTIEINGVTYIRTTDENGQILMSINLIPGIYQTIVSYENITEKVNVTVLTTIEAEDLIKYFKNGSQYYAKFYNMDGTPLANTNVTFNIHGVFYLRTTDVNGMAKLNINLNPGEYIITAWNPVNNESKANNITVLSTIFGENVVKFYRNGTQYYAYVLDENGNPLANANVTFNIHGVFYNRTTNEEGVVKLNINLNPGKYIITAWNLWNGEATSNNITVYTVVESQDLEMTTNNRKPFKVTILGEQGEPLANANVTFNIHGVFYHKTTDANGQVSLDINLIAGKYIITTYYNEYAVSNTIVVK